jgi:hypothetical protein
MTPSSSSTTPHHPIMASPPVPPRKQSWPLTLDVARCVSLCDELNLEQIDYLTWKFVLLSSSIQGIATAELVPRFEKVIAIDESESMVKLTSSHLPQVECHVASAARMPMIESGTVDLITVATAGLFLLHIYTQCARRMALGLHK